MASLRQFLLDKKYTRVRLSQTITHHLALPANINGVKGNFILDTGASSSCIDLAFAPHFKLLVKDSEVKAAGAGAVDMLTKISESNTVAIGKWETNALDIVLFDMSHVNTALQQHHADPVHGILGADILRKGKGIIDYQYNCLYLKCKK